MNRNLPALSLCLLFLLFFSVAKAQDTYQPGYAILNDGTRVSGTIILYERSPWVNQQFIWLKDSAAVAANPNGKVKPKKYKVADLKYYQVGERKFDKVHFVELDDLHFKTLGSNNHMLERLSYGRITSYRYYSYPPDMDVFTGSAEEYEEKKTNQLLAGYKVLAIKDNNGKFKDALNDNPKAYYEDTPEVLQKYLNGDYGNEPAPAKKGLGAKMMAMARKATFKAKEADGIVAAFNDYNSKNPVKQ